jgi:CubicO group peptidase (beta-lactamase class C family)
MMTIRFSLLLSLLLPMCLRAQSLYFPPTNGSWDTLSASSLGWCQDRLDSLHQFLDARDTKAFLILKGGKLVEEWYFDAFTQDSFWYWASAGKTMTATLVGIAQQEGHLDIGDPSSDYLGVGWTTCDSASERQITIRHQLTMTTGLDPDAVDADCTDDTCLQCLAPPETRWYYHNAPYTLLTRVVEAATGINNINLFFFSRIGSQIGMGGSYLNLGYNRVFVSRPRDMARFGLLMLAQGRWNGLPVLSDTAYFQAMTSPSQGLNPSYGYLWWLNGQASHRLPGSTFSFSGPIIPSAPADLIAGLGANDQKLYLVPSQELVVIRLGNQAGPLLPSLSGFDEELWAQLSRLRCDPDSGTTSLSTTSSTRITVYPNPATDWVRISSPQPTKALYLYDLQGRLRCSSHTDELSLRGVPPGSYVISWRSHQGKIGWQHLIKR